MNRNFVSSVTSSAANADAFIEQIVAGIAEDITEAVRVTGETAVMIGNRLKLSFNKYGGSNDGMRITALCDGNSWESGTINIYASSMYKAGIKIAANAKAFDMKIRNRQTSAANVCFTADVLFLVDNINEAYYNAEMQTESTSYVSKSRNFATNVNLYRCSTNIRAVTVKKRLDYLFSSGSAAAIQVTAGKILSENDIRCGTVSSLVDCSTIAGDQIYPVGGITYYAIDDNTLIEI